jgi:predicted transcriptional regulator of viral defense system
LVLWIGTLREAFRTLAGIANNQGGYFTAAQARNAGYVSQNYRYHVSHGNWERVGRGVYRLANYPHPERDDLIVISLLSHNREGSPQVVFSHDTALAIQELGDANPAHIDVTVPPRFRKRLPQVVMVHRGVVPNGDSRDLGGYRVTTPLRTITDVAAGPIEQDHLESAIRDALDRGLVREGPLLNARMSKEARKRVTAALDAIHANANPP